MSEQSHYECEVFVTEHWRDQDHYSCQSTESRVESADTLEELYEDLAVAATNGTPLDLQHVEIYTEVSFGKIRQIIVKESMPFDQTLLNASKTWRYHEEQLAAKELARQTAEAEKKRQVEESERAELARLAAKYPS